MGLAHLGEFPAVIWLPDCVSMGFVANRLLCRLQPVGQMSPPAQPKLRGNASAICFSESSGPRSNASTSLSSREPLETAKLKLEVPKPKLQNPGYHPFPNTDRRDQRWVRP